MNLDTCRLEAVAVGSLIAVQFTLEEKPHFWPIPNVRRLHRWYPRVGIGNCGRIPWLRR